TVQELHLHEPICVVVAQSFCAVLRALRREDAMAVGAIFKAARSQRAVSLPRVVRAPQPVQPLSIARAPDPVLPGSVRRQIVLDLLGKFAFWVAEVLHAIAHPNESARRVIEVLLAELFAAMQLRFLGAVSSNVELIAAPFGKPLVLGRTID